MGINDENNKKVKDYLHFIQKKEEIKNEDEK